MKVVIIGANPRTIDIAKVSVRLRWPDASMQSCSTARKGLDLVEQEWPNIVVGHYTFSLGQTTLAGVLVRVIGPLQRCEIHPKKLRH